MPLIACVWTMYYTPPSPLVVGASALVAGLGVAGVTYAATSTRPARTRALAAVTFGLLFAVVTVNVVHSYGGTHHNPPLGTLR